MTLCSGFCLVFMAQFCFSVGNKLTSPAVTAPWMLLTPSLVGLCGMVLKYESRKKMKMFGVFVSISGVAGIITFVYFTQVTNTVGLISLLFHAIGLAAGLVLWRNLLKVSRHSPLIIATWACSMGTLLWSIMYATQFYWLEKEPDIAVDLDAISHIVGIVFVISVAYACNFVILAWAARRSSVSILALYASVRPLCTLIVSFFVSETYSTLDVIVSCILLLMVLSGLLINTYSKKKEMKSMLKKQEKNIQGKLQNNFKTLAAEFHEPVDNPPVYKRLT